MRVNCPGNVPEVMTKYSWLNQQNQYGEASNSFRTTFFLRFVCKIEKISKCKENVHMKSVSPTTHKLAQTLGFISIGYNFPANISSGTTNFLEATGQ